MKGFVYKIVNKETLGFYVGSTINTKKRWNTHKLKLKKGIHSSKKLQESYNCYGESCFEFIIIGEYDNCRQIEQEILNNEKFIYNERRLATGGDMISSHPNRELIIANSIKILRQSKDKIIPRYGKDNPNWKGGVSKSNCVSCDKEIKGLAKKCKVCFHKEKCINGVKNPFYGKKHKEEVKEKLRILKTGKKNIIQSKEIIINDKTYRNAGEASIALNIKTSTIRHRVISKNKKYSEYKYGKSLTTIPKGSTLQANGSGKASHTERLEDIV